MGKRDKKKAAGKKKHSLDSPRTIVHVAHVAGSINTSDRHEESSHSTGVNGDSHIVTSILPAQLPTDDPEFVGRTQEIASLLQVLTEETSQVRAVSISGQPGVGKTALATKLAHTLAPSYPDAQIYVNLDGADGKGVDLEQVLDNVLRAIGFTGSGLPESLEEKIKHYRSALAANRILLVLDNAGNEAQVRPLLPGSAKCATIITSRSNLSGLVGVRRYSLSTLSPNEGIELLRQIIGQDRVQSEHEKAKLIVELCGGLPLALRISANKLRDRAAWPLAYYSDLLQNQRRRLRLLQAGDLAVRASFILSYDGLPENHKRVFRVLGIVPAASFSVELVTHLSGLEFDTTEGIIEDLLDANLAQLSRHPGRYRMHDLLRACARELLEEEEGSDQASSLILSMTEWYAEKAEEASDVIYGTGDVGSKSHVNPQAATDWLEIEVTGIAEVVSAAHEHEFHDLTLAISSSLAIFFQRRFHPNIWRTVTSYALQSARLLDCKKCIINALLERIKVGERTRDNDNSIGMLDEARQLSKELGSPRAESRVLAQLAKAASSRGKLPEADKMLQQSLDLSRAGNDAHQQGRCYLDLGEIHSRMGNLPESERYYQMARMRFRSVKDRHCQGIALGKIALIHLKQQNTSEALSAANMAARQFESVHDLHCLGMTCTDLAEVHIARGEVSKAEEELAKACELFKAVHDDRCLMWTLHRWASWDEEKGHIERAEEKRALAQSLGASQPDP
ncbi:ATP-binding protein [Streptomyces europaeiscabiei]|uniref:ATP-binding protein n=1 Tax=Streptomyces europaeiscabiei TaxID=146819 RepID=UPI0038F69B1B